MFDSPPKIKLSISTSPVPYREALSIMEEKVQNIIDKKSNGELWFLEHPSIIVGGSSADPQDIFDNNPLPVEHVSRGGKYTYHGPGQRICYCMLPLSYFKNDIRRFVTEIQEWIRTTVTELGLSCANSPHIGVWINKKDDTLEKLASIGFKVRKNVSFFGFSINLNPEIKHFQFFVSCGIKEAIQTSFWNEGIKLSMKDLDSMLVKTFQERFKLEVEYEECAKSF